MTGPGGNSLPTNSASLLVVGISGSDTSLAALQALVPGLSSDPRIAYVLHHLADTHHPGDLGKILAKIAPLPVKIAEHGERVHGNCLYITPPDQDSTVVDARIRLHRLNHALRGHSTDTFFGALAHQYGERCIAIALSSTGTDGLAGAREIKTLGGIVIVQAPLSAACPDLAEAVITAQLADLVVRPENMGDEIRSIVEWQDAHGYGAAVEQEPDSTQQLLDALAARTNVKVDEYERTISLNRIRRRMMIAKLASVDEYLKMISDSESEADYIVKDIVDSVSGFFRDAPLFVHIGQVLGAIISKKTGGDEIRVWVPGCATGEEAYSIAILLNEQLRLTASSYKVRIFATDIDESAISRARQAVYLRSSLDTITPSLLTRYFHAVNGVYHVKKEIRDLVVFAKHNLLQDPPFNAIDLLSCRNVLIYFHHLVRDRLIEGFLSVLNPDGYLVLGKAEGVGKYQPFFVASVSAPGIYRRESNGKKPGTAHNAQLSRPLVPATPSPRSGAVEREISEILSRYYAWPVVLIDSHLDIVHIQEPASVFIQLPPNAETGNIIESVVEPLRNELRRVIQACHSSYLPARGRSIVVADTEGRRSVTVVAIPANTPSRYSSSARTLVLFEPQPVSGSTQSLTTFDIAELEAGNVSAAQQFTNTRRDARESWRTLASSAAASLLASGEPRLVTDKSGVDSDQLDTSTPQQHTENFDTGSILASVTSVVVVVDENLQTVHYSSGSKELLDALPSNNGHIAVSTGGHPDLSFLSAEIHRCLSTQATVERELQLDDRIFLVRMSPQTIPARSRRGVAVAFIDVTQWFTAAREMHLLAAFLKNSNDAALVLAPDGQILSWNRGAERLYGYSSAEALRMNSLNFVPPDKHDEHLAFIQHTIDGSKTYRAFKTLRRHKDGRDIVVRINASALRDDTGRPYAVAITARLDAHRDAETQLEHLARVTTMGQMASGLAHELNQPLAATAHFCDAALTRAKTNSRIDDQLIGYIAGAQRQATRAGEIIRHLMRFLRKRRPNSTETDLNALIVQTLLFTEKVSEENDIAIVLQLADNLPLLPVDAVQIQQVLINLQSNSIEAMQRQNGPRRLTISTQFDGENGVLTTVSDTGSGFTAKALSQLFQPFKTTKPQGIGMGLVICRTIIEAHGGRLWIESAPDGGAVASFTLPDVIDS